MFEPIKTYGNLSEEIVSQIVQKISQGELKPGDKMPSERDMCTMFGVSRTVIRDALKTLVGLGLVTIRHGMGTYINEVSETESVVRLGALMQISEGTLEELFDIREILESKAAALCAQNAKDEDIKQLEGIIIEGKKNSKKNELALLDAEFHLKIAEAAGNKVLWRLMVNLLDLTGEIRIAVFSIPGRQQVSVLEHEAIFEAIKQRNSELAQQKMIDHLSTVKSALNVAAEDSEKSE